MKYGFVVDKQVTAMTQKWRSAHWAGERCENQTCPFVVGEFRTALAHSL